VVSELPAGPKRWAAGVAAGWTGAGGGWLHLAGALPGPSASGSSQLSLWCADHPLRPGTSFPRHLIKLTMYCYLHVDLLGLSLQLLPETWSFSAL
jgi:hypothetical protein